VLQEAAAVVLGVVRARLVRRRELPDLRRRQLAHRRSVQPEDPPALRRIGLARVLAGDEALRRVGEKQIWALMSRPFGSSSGLRITFCFLNAGSAVYGLRLLPSPLRTITLFDDARAGRVAARAAHATTSPTAPRADSIRVHRRRCVIVSPLSV